MRTFAALALTLVASCALLTRTPDHVPAGPGSTIHGLVHRVADRHDDYVSADVSLEPSAALSALADSAEARALVELSFVPSWVLEPPLERVMDRHDDYLFADTELDDLDREIFLESTNRLRAILDVAEGEE